jgi:hypothetical protein
LRAPALFLVMLTSSLCLSRLLELLFIPSLPPLCLLLPADLLSMPSLSMPSLPSLCMCSLSVSNHADLSAVSVAGPLLLLRAACLFLVTLTSSLCWLLALDLLSMPSLPLLARFGRCARPACFWSC